jgi:hypothetical protein
MRVSLGFSPEHANSKCRLLLDAFPVFVVHSQNIIQSNPGRGRSVYGQLLEALVSAVSLFSFIFIINVTSLARPLGRLQEKIVRQSSSDQSS